MQRALPGVSQDDIQSTHVSETGPADRSQTDSTAQAISIANTVKGLGNAALARGEFLEAQTFYDRGIVALSEFLDDARDCEDRASRFAACRSLFHALELNLSLACFRAGDYEPARGYADNAIRMANIKPSVGGTAKAYYRRGLAEMKLGNDAEAKKDLEKAKTLSPADKAIDKALEEVRQ